MSMAPASVFKRDEDQIREWRTFAFMLPDNGVRQPPLAMKSDTCGHHQRGLLSEAMIPHNFVSPRSRNAIAMAYSIIVFATFPRAFG
jgi:hypothetical protein